MPTPAVSAALGASTTAANPSSRASTPTAKGVRSTVVPFTRPAGFDTGEAASSAPPSASSSLPRAGRSFTAGSLRRPEWRPPLGSASSSLATGPASLAARSGPGGRPAAVAASAEAVGIRLEGFAPATADAAPHDGPASPARPGLLSRVLTSVPLSVEEVSGGR